MEQKQVCSNCSIGFQVGHFTVQPYAEVIQFKPIAFSGFKLQVYAGPCHSLAFSESMGEREGCEEIGKGRVREET